MSKIKYTYVPLDKATIIDRRHQREVAPPGMVNLENFIPARSDASPTLRPDWWYTSDQIYAISSILTLPSTSGIRDVLNSANGLYGSNQVTFFTTYVPYGIDDGTWRTLSGTHDDGTVSIAAGDQRLAGIDTTFLQNAHRGAIVRIPAGAVGSFSGAPHLFVDSPATTGEWYLAELDGTELDIIGDELFYVSPSWGGTSTWKIDTLGSLSTNKANIGDQDTLGYNAVYVRIDGNDPDTFVSGSREAFTIETATNISGSNYKWTASGSGTNEYYYTTKAGGDTIFENTTVFTGTVPVIYTSGVESGNEHLYYIKNTAGNVISDRSTECESTTLTAGVVGSLANLEIDVDDNDSLTFSTAYIRSNVGDPDTQASVRTTVAAVQVGLKLDSSTSAYKWTAASGSTNTYYLEIQAGGNPFVNNEPGLVTYKQGNTYVTPQKTAYPLTSFGWYYGDEDTLGYDTVYVRDNDGNPDVTGKVFTIYFNRTLYASNYSWVSSATANEYYLAQQDGTKLASFDEPYAVSVEGFSDSSNATRGTVGALNDGEWGHGALAGDSLPGNTIYVRWDDGDPDTENLRIVAKYRHNAYASAYKWVESPATSDEWYLVAWDGTTESDPSVGEPASLNVDGTDYTEGTVGSLAAGEYDYDDNDTLGFDTIYIYSTTDPNGAVGTGVSDETPPFVIGSEESTDSYDYYLIDRIVDDESAYILGEANTSVSGVQPTFYYNHNPFLANYKLNIQAYTSGLIYCGPTINDNLSEEDICGPFYADLLKGEWAYGGSISVDYAFLGGGVLFEKQPSLATNGLSYIQIFPTLDDSTDPDQPQTWFLGYAPAIGGNNAWTKKWFVYHDDNNTPSGAGGNAPNVTIGGDGDMMYLNSIQASGSTYISAAQVIAGSGGLAGVGTSCYPGIAYSTTPHLGLTWTTAAITSIGGGSTAWADPTGLHRADEDYQAICAAWNGASPGRIVCLVWQQIATIYALYSDDSGATWTACDVDGGSSFGTVQFEEFPKVYYLNGQFIILGDYDIFYGDGTSFSRTEIDATATTFFRDIAFDGDERWVAVKEDFTAWYTDDVTGTWTEVALPLDFTTYGDETSFITWDSIGERFVINSSLAVFWSDDGEEWKTAPISSYGESGLVKLPTNLISDSAGVSCNLYDGGSDYVRTLILSRFNYSYWNVVDFVPISDIYRASTFSVLDGYVVLIGTREYDEDGNDGAGEWTYHPRRIRWTAPATYNDFTATGSGTGDLNGEGAMLDSRPVNGRIVIFETNRVSAIVPRGDVDDPWDYDVIKEDFRILSNPVAVDDLCYIIGTDGLIYATDGIELKEVGSSYDATRFDDFSENKPIILDYSRSLNSLVAYCFDQSATSHYAYLVSLSGGEVTKISMSELSDSGGLSEEPAFITAVSDSSDQRLIVSHHPKSTATDVIPTLALTTGKQIEGKDQPVYGSSTDESYWYATLETGELYLVPEGQKTALKHIIVRTYSDAPGTNTDRPRIIAQIKSLEDDEWHTAGKVDVFSSFDIDTTTCTTTGEGESAFTNLMLEGSGAGGSTVTVIPPFSPPGCRYYKETGGTYTLQTSGTDYTATAASAVFTDNGPAAGTDLYAYWENHPEIRIETGHLVESSESLHRVTGTTGTNATGGLTLDHYLSTGTEEISTHYPSVQIPDGEGEVKIGVNKLVEGFKLRLLVVPEYGATAAPTIVKITGIVFGHVPQGRKILEASGS